MSPFEKQGRGRYASLSFVFFNPPAAAFRINNVTLLNLAVDVAVIASTHLVDDGDTTPSLHLWRCTEATDDDDVR